MIGDTQCQAGVFLPACWVLQVKQGRLALLLILAMVKLQVGQSGVGVTLPL